jgi:hypothetical protein
MNRIKLSQDMAPGLRQMLTGDNIDRQMACEILQNSDINDPTTFEIIGGFVLDTELMLCLEVVQGALRFEIPYHMIVNKATNDLALQD